MAKLVWDEAADRFYETGVDHGVLYVMNSDSTYNDGVAWNGLTGVTESPEGAEPNDLWADNIKYATLYSAETFGATIEAYTYPEEFAQCDGSYSPMNGFYFGQQERKSFGFSYRTKVGNAAGLENYKLHIIYNCKASPSEKSYETVNDSPDAITFSWEITTVPVNPNITGKTLKPMSNITIDINKYVNESQTYKTAREAAIARLEDVLYGKDAGNGVTATNPTLPTIAQVYDILYKTESNADGAATVGS